jgi:RIO kinase 1
VQPQALSTCGFLHRAPPSHLQTAEMCGFFSYMTTGNILMTAYFEPDEADYLTEIKNLSNDEKRQLRQPAGRRKARKAKNEPAQEIAQLLEQEAEQEQFDFTYQASRHERQWLEESLGGFFEHQWFDDVLRLLKGGKEASVYQCTAKPPVQGDYLAAKVYRPRMFRGMRNDHVYRAGRQNLDGEGRVITDDGMLHAIRKGTSYGKELLHTSWIEHEFQAMQILHAAGADVPFPYACSNNAILMEYIGDEGEPAPVLSSIRLPKEEARTVLERVLKNIEILLSCGLVHADLSAYNILYWEGAITLIDFPQVIHPQNNLSAYPIFQRDLRRVCEYFHACGVRCDAGRLASDLWRKHGLDLGPQIDPRRLTQDAF